MAIFGKDKAQDAASAGRQPEWIVAREGTTMSERSTGSTGAGGVDAFLGKGTRVSGKLTFEGAGRIEGHVEGEITAENTLTIGESAVVQARVAGTTVVIEGQVVGDVVARQRLELRASARVRGNVTAPTLVVHEGALLDGQCSMSAADVRAAYDAPDTAATWSLDQTRDAAMDVASTLSR